MNIGSKLAFSVLMILMIMSSGACVVENDDRIDLKVLASTSLKKPMTEIAKAYQEQYPLIKINLNFDGSGTLVTQIVDGAPADVIILGAQSYMHPLESKGLVQWDNQSVLIENWLVLVTSKNNPNKLRCFNDLTMNSVRRVSLNNPKIYSSGVYANEVLAYFGISEQIKDKLIYCDQVTQLIDYVVRGDADAGILFYTDYLSHKDQLSLIDEAPHYSHSPIIYPVAVVKNSKQITEANIFIKWLYSDKSRSIMTENGFKITDVNPQWNMY